MKYGYYEEENKLAIIRNETRDKISELRSQITHGSNEIESISQNIQFNKTQHHKLEMQNSQLAKQLEELRVAINTYKELSQQLNVYS